MVKHSNLWHSIPVTLRTFTVDKTFSKGVLAFNSKPIEVTLTSTNFTMATLKEVKDTRFFIFRG